MPNQFAQLSDPHLTSLEQIDARDLMNKRALGYLSWRRRRRFEHNPQVLAALREDLHGGQFDQLLITGDLTHIGLPQEFRQAAAWLREMGEPADVALVPGNHDACVSTDAGETFDLWRDYMRSDGDTPGSEDSPQFPTLRVRAGIAYIGLSTAVPKLPLMATGTVGEEQLQRLPPLLRAAREQGLFRVVYLHHCPLPGHEKWRKRLTDADRLQQLLQQHGVELVLHGHGHRRRLAELHTDDGTAPVIAVPSASALGLHGADVAQYNCYGITPAASGWMLDIAARVYQPASGRFAAGEHVALDIVRQWRQE